jgi:transposase
LGYTLPKNGKLINADVNGSYNILRKSKPNAFEVNGVMGVVVHPVIIKKTN